MYSALSFSAHEGSKFFRPVFTLVLVHQKGGGGGGRVCACWVSILLLLLLLLLLLAFGFPSGFHVILLRLYEETSFLGRSPGRGVCV